MKKGTKTIRKAKVGRPKGPKLPVHLTKSQLRFLCDYVHGMVKLLWMQTLQMGKVPIPPKGDSFLE